MDKSTEAFNSTQSILRYIGTKEEKGSRKKLVISYDWTYIHTQTLNTTEDVPFTRFKIVTSTRTTTKCFNLNILYHFTKYVQLFLFMLGTYQISIVNYFLSILHDYIKSRSSMNTCSQPANAIPHSYIIRTNYEDLNSANVVIKREAAIV